MEKVEQLRLGQKGGAEFMALLAFVHGMALLTFACRLLGWLLTLAIGFAFAAAGVGVRTPPVPAGVAVGGEGGV